MRSPLVSVIIPFLNGGPWLAEAIESVINQSYSNWEIRLVDDGSEKVHSRIGEDYSSRYPEKIFYTDHPGHINMGVTVSRNVGISRTKGKYLAFLDSDDCWFPQKLRNQLELFDLYPEAAMICEASSFWYSWDNPAVEDVQTNVGAAPDRLYHPPQLIYTLYPLGTGAPPCPTGIIIRRDAFDRSGGFEESFSGVNQLYEDQAFLCKIYLTENVFVSGAANNRYRKRSGSLTESGNDEKHYYRVRTFFLNWLEKYLAEHNTNNTKIMDLIQEARFKIKNS